MDGGHEVPTDWGCFVMDGGHEVPTDWGCLLEITDKRLCVGGAVFPMHACTEYVRTFQARSYPLRSHHVPRIACDRQQN